MRSSVIFKCHGPKLVQSMMLPTKELQRNKKIHVHKAKSQQRALSHDALTENNEKHM